MIPTAVRNFGDAVTAGDEIGPEAVEILRPRETASDADEGNRRSGGRMPGAVFDRFDARLPNGDTLKVSALFIARTAGLCSHTPSDRQRLDGQPGRHLAQGSALVEQRLGDPPVVAIQPVVQLRDMHRVEGEVFDLALGPETRRRRAGDLGKKIAQVD